MIRLSLAAILLGFLGGCSNEVFEGDQQTANDRLTVIIPSIDTKMAMGGAADKTPLWSTGDKISVFTKTSGSYATQEYTLSEGEGTQSGTFTGNCPEGAVKEVACFPWVKGASYDGTKIMLAMPAAHAHKASDNNGAPMAAKIGNQETISFKNAGALVDVTIKNIPAGYDKVILASSGLNAPDITGSMEITFDDKGVPSLKSVSGASNGKEIVISFTATADLQNLRFYFPIPLGTYPELKVSLDNSSASKPLEIKTFRGADGNGIVAERGKLYTGEITIDKITGEVPVEVATAGGVKDELSKEGVNAVAVADVTGNDPKVELPKRTDSDTPVSISFEKISTGNELKVEESTSGTGGVAKSLTLGIPAPIKSQDGKDITPTLAVTLPNSTVTVSASSGTTTIAKLTAKTATNTLIIEKGVTVKELVIVGGNVKIYGNVEKIARSSGNQDATTTVTTYESGTIGTVTTSGEEDAKFAFKSVWDGVSKATAARADNNIYTAAELAYYQSANIPVNTSGANLTATMTVNTTLRADIDLNNKPWIGMVLGEDITFHGTRHTVSNVLVKEHVLTENGLYTPAACVGLFAATKKNSAIKKITVDGFVAEGAGADAKWSGALVGYSYGTVTYAYCHAKNVKIESESADAYRIGGLIGFIANVSDVAVTVSNCSVDRVTIKGGHSLGGFIGTIQGGNANARTISSCTANNITIQQNENSCALTGNGSDSPKEYAGNLSPFIGDTGSATIALTSCTATAFTTEECEGFGYSSIKGANGEIWKLSDATSPLIPAQAAGDITIDGTKMANGTNYNRFTLIKSGSNNAEGYTKEDGSWN